MENQTAKGHFNEKKQWFCIQTKPKCEDVASINIAAKDILVFNPKIEEFYNGSKRVAPLFPGYILAHFSPATAYYKIVWTPGVKQILGYNNQPTAVAEEVVYLIMDRLENKHYIRPKFKVGDTIRVKNGPFSRLIGILKAYCPAKERVKVLLSLFNQAVEVELDAQNLETVAGTSRLSQQEFM